MKKFFQTYTFFKHTLNGKENLLPAQLNLVYCQQVCFLFFRGSMYFLDDCPILGNSFPFKPKNTRISNPKIPFDFSCCVNVLTFIYILDLNQLIHHL